MAQGLASISMQVQFLNEMDEELKNNDSRWGSRDHPNLRALMCARSGGLYWLPPLPQCRANKCFKPTSSAFGGSAA